MAKRKRTLWDIETDKELKLLLAIKGLGIDAISKTLKRSSKAIRRRCERLKISSSSIYTKNQSVKDC